MLWSTNHRLLTNLKSFQSIRRTPNSFLRKLRINIALARGADMFVNLGIAVFGRDRGDFIDVNPFVLKRRGGVALDALVVLAGG